MRLDSNLSKPEATFARKRAARSAEVPVLPHNDFEAPMGWPWNREAGSAYHIGHDEFALSELTYSWRATSCMSAQDSKTTKEISDIYIFLIGAAMFGGFSSWPR